MKKILIIIAFAVAISLTGCASGSSGTLNTPIKNRTQDIDPNAMDNVENEIPKQFDEGIKKYKDIKKYTFNEIKNTDKNLYNLMLPILQEAQKMYKERNLPKNILDKGPKWLIGDLNNLNITLAKSTKSTKFNGQYSPFNNILLVNYNNSIDKDLVRFLLAHELAHAISLHVSEDKTNEQKTLNGAKDATNLALDIALNKAYKSLNSALAQTLDTNAKLLEGVLYTRSDIHKEEQIINSRSQSFIAKAAIAANQTDKLKALGIGLKIPLQTKLAIKGLMNNGMKESEALKALQDGAKFVNTQVVVMSGHTKEQEMEADSIALELTRRAGFDVQNAACKRFKGSKQAGLFDNHPSYDVRRANLGCVN